MKYYEYLKTHAIRTNLDFLFEKRNKPYIRYGEVSIVEKKSEVIEEVSGVSGSARKQAD